MGLQKISEYKFPKQAHATESLKQKKKNLKIFLILFYKWVGRLTLSDDEVASDEGHRVTREDKVPAEHLQETQLMFLHNRGDFLKSFIQHCFICRPSDSTVSKDAGIEPRTLAYVSDISDFPIFSFPLQRSPNFVNIFWDQWERI